MEAKDLEAILKTAVRDVFLRYPDVEWEDLEGQAWLIVSEVIGQWDPSRSSLTTYLYGRIVYGLQDYIRRVVLKEYNMCGLRDHVDYLEAETEDFSTRIDAKMQIEKLVEESSGVARDILLLMSKGYSQLETAEQLGVSRQYVNEVLMKIRKRYKDGT